MALPPTPKHHRLLYQSDALTLDYYLVDDYLHAIWAREQDAATTRAGYEHMLGFDSEAAARRALLAM